MMNIDRKHLREYAMNLLIIAAVAVIIVGTYFHQIQSLLPVAALLLALRIFLMATDTNLRRLSGILSFYFGTSTLSNVAWYLVPAIVDNDFVHTANYFYITGMFWLVGYAAIAYVLLNMKNSKQWYIDRRISRLITAIATSGFFMVALLVFLNMRWDSSHVIDILLLLVYLCFDIIILMMTLNLLYMNLKRNLRLLVHAVLLFFGINMLGDLLFECRWLFKLSSMASFNIIGLGWSLNIRNTTDLIYEVSLLLMTGYLFLYVIDPFRNRALDDARRRLKDTQLFVDDLVAKSPDATCICSRDGGLLLVNDSFLRTFGMDRKDMNNSNNLFSYMSQIISDDRTSRQILNVRNGETVIIPKIKISDIKGGRQGDFYINLKMFPTFGTNGRVINYVMIIEDITERNRAEEALRESEEKYRSLVENINDMVWETDAEGKCTYASPKARDLLGDEPEDVLGKTPFQYMAPEDMGRVRDIVEPLLARHEPFGLIEYTVVHKDGTRVIVESSGTPMFGSDGLCKGYMGVNRDITERKRAEEALRESEEKFRKLAETSPAAIIIFQDERIVYVNHAGEQQTGYTVGELLAIKPSVIMHPDDRKPIEDKLSLRIQGVPLAEHYDAKIVTKDGRELWVNISTTATTYMKKPAGMAICIDITERKKAEDALRQSEASLAKAQTIAHIGSWEWDITSNKGRWSDELFNIYGLDKNGFDPAYEAFLSRIHPDDRSRVMEAMSATLNEARPYNLDFRIIRPDGTERMLHCEGELAYDKDGKPIRIFGIGQDITERIRLEKELFDAYHSLKKEYERRMDFTNAAAHELRTPLTPIIGYTDILKSEVMDERHRKYLEIIERNAIRQKNMVNRMLELASLDAGMAHVNSTEFPLRPLVNEIADNYRTVNPDIRVDVPEGLRVTSDADVIRHVLDNLVSNAVKYNSNGGQIEIRAVEDSDHYRLSVKDRGAGIPRDEWDRIFERFYIVGGDRDNRTSGRVGLGLALVKAYVNLIGGTVWLESEPGKGSTFFFTVPKVSQSSGLSANV